MPEEAPFRFLFSPVGKNLRGQLPPAVCLRPIAGLWSSFHAVTLRLVRSVSV